ncbi:formate dehydrogenase subunit delta [Burkholderia glumae]|uniref:Formate dehydrogenase subunit delta n=1 Tax=Burkholderia glumae TaxID=337 RepID=A0AAQ0BUH1_BURGL|nr:formate dehydrogenase subunit delta [Burkholderia glumae]ACR28040.1 NAD-dependent formate dehydrogenase subunit delta [Burkholderia glumae BGR1]AJY67690.1 NADH-dependent formate dehydrogenase delta subunit FdsD family protein [Burkholderia glumae LMG 2196 = ATCC 33617]KHJ61298.1 formate dehydrogenase [Burkholderia glumae]MCM2480978.1 formate dehydrogenase subunit delta [Burkholderia glumae]MCM2492335.1 formate dehydrogenase subunit delta [Burkholderia glumae]
MKVDHLITMANQIGTFFGSMPDHDEAVNGIADHIRRFWEPRMRRTLLAALDGDDPAGHALLPVVREALLTHRTALEPMASPAH